MKILLWGTPIFVILLAVHLVLWRIYLPRRQVRTVLALLLGGSTMGLWALASWPESWALPGGQPRLTASELSQVGVYLLALTFSYLITYTAIEADSPSLVITSAIASTDAVGLTQNELYRRLDDELLILPRVEDLVRDGWVRCEAGRYRLTGKGLMFARLFGAYRRLLGLGKGG
jgi:hypothetical protein